MCVYVYTTISYTGGRNPAAKNIIFPGPGIVSEGSLETCAAGCISCCLPEHIPSFRDGEQLCLLKCKFPLDAVMVAAEAEPSLGYSDGKDEEGRLYAIGRL